MDNGNKRKYDASQIEVLRTTSMRDILAALGYCTDHTPGGLYFSPFRKEDTPSFHIDDAKHRWFDHGDMMAGSDIRKSGKGGGDPISLVRLLKGCSFVEALDYLSAFNPSVIPHVEDRIITQGSGHGGVCVDLRVDEVKNGVQSKSLRDYAVSERCIPAEILDRYMHQVQYTVSFADPKTGDLRDSSYFAIGNRNVGGGWNLRYPAREKGKGKRAIKGDLEIMWTAFDSAGRECLASVGEDEAVIMPKATSHNVVVFEGAMDFLSWMAWTNRTVPRDTDVVVLNSTEHARSALPYITSHMNVIGYLDNDRAGGTATGLLEKECEKASSVEHPVRFYDKRSAFAPHNDVNDAWRKVYKVRQEKALQARLAERQSQSPVESQKVQPRKEGGHGIK